MPHNGDPLSFFPLELRGFVLAAIAVLAAILVFQALRLLRRPLGRAAGRATSARDKAAARETALAEGFLIDEVERDMPDPASPLMVLRGTCARYQWPDRMPCNAHVVLMRRPGQSTPGLAPGWLLAVLRDTPSTAVLDTLAQMTYSSIAVGGFLEMEILNNMLYFYWDEAGGKKGVSLLKNYAEQLRSIS